MPIFDIFKSNQKKIAEQERIVLDLQAKIDRLKAEIIDLDLKKLNIENKTKENSAL